MSDVTLIAAQTDRILSSFRFKVVTATELEFYIPGSDAYGDFPVLWKEVAEACKAAGMVLFKMEKEKGVDQHEIAIAPADPIKTASDTYALKGIVSDIAIKHGLIVDFSAKPFPDQPGSGLHIHVNLVDEQGRNVFYKSNAIISDPLKYSVGGLLSGLQECMAVFAPNENSYTRFIPATNVPLTVSWGANNRTVALRLPDTQQDNKRIEHRVCGADADPIRVMAVLLAAMHAGMTRRIEPSPQIYGDAALALYKLPRLPMTLQDSMERFKASPLLAEYFGPDSSLFY